jgi:putative iron-only hydrogenase system regulator
MMDDRQAGYQPPTGEPDAANAETMSQTQAARSGRRMSTPRAAGASPEAPKAAASPMTPQPAGNRSRKRYGFVGIIVPHSAGQGPAIQGILSDHAALIQGRMGLPHLEDDRLAIITLIVHGSTDELGSLTGSLGRLAGVTVKSGLAPLPGQETAS